MNLSKQAILRKLRPPSLKPVRIVFPYQRESPPNYGYTLAIAVNDAVVAPGDGQTIFVRPAMVGWRFNNPQHGRTYAVCIDHGQGVKTYVHGIVPAVNVGSRISRGQLLGRSVSGEVFFAVEVDRGMINPAVVSEYFSPRDGVIFYEQPNFVRQAPTLIRQAFSTVADLLWAGLHYFLPSVPPPLLFNVDFYGDGTKIGAAATWVTDTDFWNVYDPVDFTLVGYACYYAYGGYGYLGMAYNQPPLVPLNDYQGRHSKVFLERVLPLSSAAGAATSWDPMMATWVGGYTGSTPYVNTFGLRGLPRGNYTIYLYSEQGSPPHVSYFQVTVDGYTQTGQTNPTGASAFSSGENYVAFDISLGYRSVVLFTTSGYLSGMQIKRN